MFQAKLRFERVPLLAKHSHGDISVRTCREEHLVPHQIDGIKRLASSVEPLIDLMRIVSTAERNLDEFNAVDNSVPKRSKVFPAIGGLRRHIPARGLSGESPSKRQSSCHQSHQRLNP